MLSNLLTTVSLLLTAAHGVAGWSEVPASAVDGPLLAREEHTMLAWGSMLVLFGGRSNDRVVNHRPRTFTVDRVNGTLAFTSYDDRDVLVCVNGRAVDTGVPAAARALRNDSSCYDITVATLHNDVWVMNTSSPAAVWKPLLRGAAQGGCYVMYNQQVCTHPGERYGHGAAILRGSVMYVYGGYSPVCEDYCSDLWSLDLLPCAARAAPGYAAASNAECVWRRVTTAAGPGKRWRFASTSDGNTWYLFGGHRLWHGLAEGNSAANKWSASTRFPFGGYLDDMWRFDAGSETWTQVIPMEACYSMAAMGGNGGAAALRDWADRTELLCTVTWPSARSQAAMTLQNGNLFLHGGYAVPFPYPFPSARGSGPGVAALATDGKVAYPTYPYYMKDMWVYNIAEGLWTERQQLPRVPRPPPTVNEARVRAPDARAAHAMLTVDDDMIMLHGGYASNNFKRDMWFYSSRTDQWTPKQTYVQPLYPASCTSDIVMDERGVEVAVNRSVAGEPTRGTQLDGLDGRAASPVTVLQPRRRAPGWDGCRDRADGRTDLPAELQWVAPNERRGHAVVHLPETGIVYMFGGLGYLQQQAPTVNTTYPRMPLNDTWLYDMRACAAGCSGHGSCAYGFCICEDGWSGIDCSNMTCPGDWCTYPDGGFEQTCTPCCSTVHVDDSVTAYVPFAAADACSASVTGVSRGICDGFGACQCTPPFLGPNCGTRDCPSDCSGHGWCSVEAPVARCMCEPPWNGNDCSILSCPNDCSAPNGVCQADGTCACNAIPNPYNNQQNFTSYGGPDCSYITPFAGAHDTAVTSALLVLVLVAACACGAWTT